ncbi:ATP-grasp fold amidoligase family protein [Vagococcus fluvialis]|uniref:ATP-grasp fold amidoligase family protein n=1 Tax=Vagococcus fluvialis TaxID=2738 RepID=UPI00379AF6CC
MKVETKMRILNLGFKIFPKTTLKMCFKRNFGYELDLKKPKTYSEKLQWLKFYYATNEEAILAGDKAGLHDYLSKKQLEHLLVPLVGVYNNVAEINWNLLPEQFVMKKSNSSGMNIIVVDKSKSDEDKIKNKMNNWMKTTYGEFGAELHYSKMDSKIVIEKYIEGIGEDWRIIFLNGIPKMIHVSQWVGDESDNYSGHRDSVRIYADIDGKIRHLATSLDSEKSELEEGEYIDLPVNFLEMVEYGKKIATDFPLVRVDYFHANGELYIGELTFTPGGGFTPLNEELQKELGNQLILPKEK